MPDAENLVRELKPRVAVLTHYGMGVWQAHPWEIAERMSAATGVMVKAGRDRMKLDLAELGANDPPPLSLDVRGKGEGAHGV